MMLLALVLLVCLTSCGKGGNADDTSVPNSDSTVETTPVLVPNVTIAAEGKSDYIIVFAHGADNFDRAFEFRTLFSKATGINLQYEKDSTREGVENACEIVIGRTDRDKFFDIDLDSLASDAYIRNN